MTTKDKAAAGNADDRPAVDIFVEHYKTLCDERRSLYVPELGITIYAKPMNAAQFQSVLRREAQDGTMDGVIEAMLLMCEDEAGNKMFPKPAKDRLVLRKQVDHNLVLRIGKWCQQAPAPEDMAKN